MPKYAGGRAVYMGWAVLRLGSPGVDSPPAPERAPKRARQAPRNDEPRHLPPFAVEVRQLARDGACMTLDMATFGAECTDACRDYVARWSDWARTAFHGVLPVVDTLRAWTEELALQSDDATELVVPGVALALLRIPASDEEYQQAIGAKSRNMLRKAQRAGIVTGPFQWNARLDEIHDINTSKPVRSGGPMTPGYLDPPAPIAGDATLGCRLHPTLWVGAQRDGRLVGYGKVAVVGDLAVIDQILGHADALRDGVMNALVHALVSAARESSTITAINYLTLRSSTASLDRFKRSVGFEATATLLRVLR